MTPGQSNKVAVWETRKCGPMSGAKNLSIPQPCGKGDQGYGKLSEKFWEEMPGELIICSKIWWNWIPSINMCKNYYMGLLITVWVSRLSFLVSLGPGPQMRIFNTLTRQLWCGKPQFWETLIYRKHLSLLFPLKSLQYYPFERSLGISEENREN